MTRPESPGEFPFTRGIHPAMYRDRLWTMRQYAGFGSVEESNRRYRYLLSQGITGLSVAFDLPTQIGYDSDHPMSAGEVGRVGVPISTADDFARLFDQIPMREVSVSMTINATAPILLAFCLAAAERQGTNLSSLRGTIQNDILKEYAARGTYIFGPAPSLRLATDLIEFSVRNLPKWNPISVSGYHIREAGATAAQELGFTFANAAAYLQACLDRGLSVDEVAPKFSFFFNAQMDLFEEVAKFRAARRIWARLVRDRFGARDPRSMMCRFHVQTAGSSLTAQQPLNNIVRTTLEALAAVLGGTQSLHTNAHDEALALPTEESATLALRIQQVIAYESGVTAEPDPLHGSYYVEALTDRLEEEGMALVKAVEERGGAVEALTSGWIQNEIAQSAYEAQKAVESKRRIIVGVNEFAREGEPEPATLSVDEEAITRQISRLREFRARRDSRRTLGSLEALRGAAKSGMNLMPFAVDAAKSGATLGEISDTLRDVFGEHRT